MSDGPTWEMLGYIAGATSLGVGAIWVLIDKLVPRKEYDVLEKRVDELEKHPSSCPIGRDYVSKESLLQQLKPINDELEHRRKSMDNLGRSFGELQKMVHRMDKSIAAIAAKLNVTLSDDE